MDLVIENVGRRSETWAEEGAPTDVGNKSLNGYERNLLFWNRGEDGFVDVAYLAEANLIEDGRGVAIADFDRDGRLDLVVQNLDKPAALLMARGETGHWLQIELEGTTSNRDAIGATVAIEAGGRRQLRQLRAGSGFMSASSNVLHFGIGAETEINAIEVRWPSGERTQHGPVAADSRVRLTEGK